MHYSQRVGYNPKLEANLYFALTDHVGQEECSCEDELSELYRSSKEGSRVSQLKEGHEVHPLILSLLQQGVDPTMVPLHPPQRVQMPHHSSSEARYTGN